MTQAIPAYILEGYRREQVAKVLASTRHHNTWKPNPDHADGTPNTQRLAFESKADIIGLSGTAGWGKTDLMLGLAALKHKRSVIFRRVFPNLRAIIERSREIFAGGLSHSEDSFNESLHRWSFSNGSKMLEFEACQAERDKYKQRGRARDMYGFDEVTEFTRSMVEFISGWNRSPDAKQHCQIVLAFNVPSDESGTWVIDYFLPWIAYLFPAKFSHPNPAKPGELRWYATIEGKETECASEAPFQHGDELVYPRSRTFFFGTLADNPYYDENYTSVLQSMPEPERSRLLYGNFAADTEADPWQCIPTAWVKLAQQRWLEREKPEMPLSGVGNDIARGGRDALTISKRYGTWFDEVKKVPGVNVEDGPAAAQILWEVLKDEPYIGYINIDVIGVGTSAFDSAKVLWPGKVKPINASEKSEHIVFSRTQPPHPLFKMKNRRAEYYWKMREALDPEFGKNLALPPGNALVSDLCAARYKIISGGIIQIEEKNEIKARIGRSPDEGEAVMLANLDIQSDKLPKQPAIVSRWQHDTIKTPAMTSGGSRWKR